MKEFSVTPPPAVKGKEETVIKVEVVNSTPKHEEKVVKDEADRPLSAEYFDIPEWGHYLLEPKLDVNGLVSKISFIEDFLSTKLKANSMKVEKDTMRDILCDIENSLGIDSKHSLEHRISRVYGFLNVIRVTKEKEDERRKRLVAMLKK